MTQEEIDNLQVGDIYERADLKEIRIISAISTDCISYTIHGLSPKGNWNFKDELLTSKFRLIGKANNNMDTFDIKPGMVLITAEDLVKAKNEDTYMAFLDGNNKISVINFAGKGWTIISPNMHVGGRKIHYVLDRPSACIRDGKVLWKRQEVKEMTVAEIEQKLGMQAGTLRIKK